MKKRAQMDSSFAWIFAIIAGAIILFLVIYGVSKFINLQRTGQSAESAKQIDVLLNPLESGYETGQKIIIYASAETRIFSYCTLEGAFGKQKIQTLEKTYGEWTPTGVNVTSMNKYIFTENPAEGRRFVVFSKPFELSAANSNNFPFKIADLIYLINYDKQYCFTGLLEHSDIKEEINNLNIENLFTENCPQGSLKICFGGEGGCYVKVERNTKTKKGFVKKGSEEMYFNNDASMYAAIFSDHELYECQLARIIKRAEQLTIIYGEKSRIERNQGCSSELEFELIFFRNILKNYENSWDLSIILDEAKQLNKKNSMAGECKLW